ncbi:MAG: hypothetical protein QW035_03090 [Candidatus Anstonellales archaeon]
MIVWLFWVCAALAVGSALLASYLKYGEVLGIVKGKQAIALAGIVIFVISVLGVAYMLLFSPYGASQENPAWIPWLWVSVFILLLGAMVVSFSARAGKTALLKKEVAAKWFNVGYAIAIIGSALLVYILLPGNLVP